MSRDRIARGARGEAMAAAYLEERGYRILARNLRTQRGELDLVALDGAALVFVEVRTRTGTRFGSPEESVDRRKQRRLVRAAAAALAERRWPRHARVRFDVVAVILGPSPAVRLVRDAFYAPSS